MTTPRDDIAGLSERLRLIAPDEDDNMPWTRKAMLEAATQLTALSEKAENYYGNLQNALAALEKAHKRAEGWHRIAETIATVLDLPEPESDFAGKVRDKFDALQARVKELEALVYVPGSWHCPKCKFTLLQSNLNAQDGTVTARDTPGDKCPNCTGPLWRCSWKNDAFEMQERAVEQMDRAKAAETRATRLQQERDEAVDLLRKMTDHSIDDALYPFAECFDLARDLVRRLASGPEKEKKE